MRDERPSAVIEERRVRWTLSSNEKRRAHGAKSPLLDRATSNRLRYYSVTDSANPDVGMTTRSESRNSSLCLQSFQLAHQVAHIVCTCGHLGSGHSL